MAPQKKKKEKKKAFTLLSGNHEFLLLLLITQPLVVAILESKIGHLRKSKRKQYPRPKDSLHAVIHTNTGSVSLTDVYVCHVACVIELVEAVCTCLFMLSNASNCDHSINLHGGLFPSR